MAPLGYFISLALAVVSTILAAPTKQGLPHPTLEKRTSQQYYLRANCPTEPWNGRHLVPLGHSGQLGLENFTIHPDTPPVTFQLVRLYNDHYALQGEASDESDSTPYLAALESTDGTRTASMAIVYASSPADDSFAANPEACPEGYKCVADQWTVDDAGSDMFRPNFRYAGFEGNWQPFKDAKSGWHVYWKGNAGLYHKISLDLVPVDGSGDSNGGEECGYGDCP